MCLDVIWRHATSTQHYGKELPQNVVQCVMGEHHWGDTEHKSGWRRSYDKRIVSPAHPFCDRLSPVEIQQGTVKNLSHWSRKSTDTQTQRTNQARTHMIRLYNVYNEQNDIILFLIVTGSPWFLYRNVTLDWMWWSSLDTNTYPFPPDSTAVCIVFGKMVYSSVYVN